MAEWSCSGLQSRLRRFDSDSRLHPQHKDLAAAHAGRGSGSALIMCGIAGYLSTDSRARDALPAMTGTLAHRGADDDGLYFDGPVGLGHRRLSIIDVQGSPQPLIAADGAIAVVFNGEIYNFRKLRQELTAAGRIFRTDGDGEVLLHAWRMRGEAMLDALSGMFAFALWDRQQRRLLLARDRFGEKPLYYAWNRGTLVF